jgi:hypothetical protein
VAAARWLKMFSESFQRKKKLWKKNIEAVILKIKNFQRASLNILNFGQKRENFFSPISFEEKTFTFNKF